MSNTFFLHRVSRFPFQALAYRVGDDGGGFATRRVWYSQSPAVCGDYLRCLLDARRLREEHGVQEVPHWRAQASKDYHRLFQGKPLNEPVRFALSADVAESEDEVEVDGPGRLEFPGAVRNDDDDDRSFASSLGRALQALGDGEPEEPEDTGAPGPPGVPSAHPEELEGAQLDPDLWRLGDGTQTLSFEWGVSRVARVFRDPTDYIGGVQCICKFHKLSRATGCKRFFPFSESTPEAMTEALVQGKHWLNMAEQFTRQRSYRDVVE